MNRVSLTVIGSINEDIAVTSEHLPRAGETVAATNLIRMPGGKGANQAAAASRLGADVRMIGARGNDDAGERCTLALQDAGVDVTSVQVVDLPTGTALIVVDSHGENQIAVAAGANAAVALDDSIAEAPAILCQLETPIEVVAEAIHQAQGFVALNAAPAVSLPPKILNRCDVIIVNEEEFQSLPELTSAQAVAVTLGSRGAVMIRNGKPVARSEAPTVPVVSSVGAGDAFCAALVLGILAGMSDMAALRAACAVGAAAVGFRNTQPKFADLATYLGATDRRS